MMEVPKGWERISVGECLINSVLRNTDERFSHNDLRAVNKSLGMIPMKDRVKGKSVERAKVVKKNWFAYNPMRINIGSLCRWDNDEDCIVSPDYVVFTCNENVLLTDYFDHFRRSYRWCRFMDDAGRGSVRIRIYLDDLRLLYFPLPPISEQIKIAAILSTWDAAITAQKKLIAASEAQKKALMQQLLTGKKRLKGFSGEWEEIKLGIIGDISSAGIDKKINPSEQEVRLLNYLDVFRREKIFDYELKQVVTSPENKILQCNIKKGDIFFTPSSETRDDLAISAVISEDISGAVYSYHIVRLRPLIQIDLNFSAFIFQTDDFKRQAYRLGDGSGQRYVISQKAFRNMVVKLPPLEEQEAIGRILENCSLEVHNLKQKLHCLTQEKAALMQQLLTGKRRVTLDSTEESA